MRQAWFKFIALILLCSLLCACGSEQIAKEINQNQANEIVAVLNAHGISASSKRDSGSSGKYSVSVDTQYLTAAIAILNDLGLPKRSRFAEAIEPRGLIPNSREMETLRVNYAKGLEIEELLESHPSIAAATVSVSRDPSNPDVEVGVTAIVTTRNGRTISQAEVSALISRQVPGLKPDNITVSVNSSDNSGNVFFSEGATNSSGRVIRVPLVPFLFGWKVAESDYDALAIAVFAFLIVVGLLSAFLGYSYGSYRSTKSDVLAGLPEPLAKSERLGVLPKNIGE